MLNRFIGFVQERWDVIRLHWIAFLVLAVGGLVGGWISAKQFYAQHITTIEERLKLRDDEIGRLRVALGIDPASKGALIALTDEELRAKSLAVASQLRNLCFSYRDRQAAIDEDERSGKVDRKGAAERWKALLQEASDDFDRTSLRPEAFNVDSELRRRLDPKAVAAIPNISPSIRDMQGNAMSMMSVFSSGYSLSAARLCQLADGIDRMSELLPLTPPG